MTIFSMNPDFEKYFDRNFRNSENDSYTYGNCGCNPKTNIRKVNNEYFLDMSVPGLEKSDIKIKVEKDTLEVSHEKEENNHFENTSDSYLRREFAVKNFKRSFTLPEKTDIDKISASFKNGILTILLPVKEEEKTKLSHTIKVS